MQQVSPAWETIKILGGDIDRSGGDEFWPPGVGIAAAAATGPTQLRTIALLAVRLRERRCCHDTCCAQIPAFDRVKIERNPL